MRCVLQVVATDLRLSVHFTRLAGAMRIIFFLLSFNASLCSGTCVLGDTVCQHGIGASISKTSMSCPILPYSTPGHAGRLACETL